MREVGITRATSGANLRNHSPALPIRLWLAVCCALVFWRAGLCPLAFSGCRYKVDVCLTIWSISLSASAILKRVKRTPVDRSHLHQGVQSLILCSRHSLSAPSWSLLDTGQHLQIKANVEFDRYILYAYDYLNFLPFYFKNAGGGNVDMPGVEVLDSLGVPLLMDAYPRSQRYPSFQLYQRGMRFSTLSRSAEAKFLRNPIELLEDWTAGPECEYYFDQLSES